MAWGGVYIVAFDVAPANQILNALANEKGLPFDRNGELASNGVVDEELFSLLNDICSFCRYFVYH